MIVEGSRNGFSYESLGWNQYSSPWKSPEPEPIQNLPSLENP